MACTSVLWGKQGPDDTASISGDTGDDAACLITLEGQSPRHQGAKVQLVFMIWIQG